MIRKAAQPEDFARALLSRLGITRADDLNDLARRIGLSIREVDARGFEAALVRARGRSRGIIAVRRDIGDSGRRRFGVAHEIGHYVLPGHGSSGAACTSDSIDYWERSDEDEPMLQHSVGTQESAANHFAAELLLPSSLIAPIVAAQSVSVSTARWVAESFHASLTAAALKCVEVAPEACALVVSTNGVVKFVKPNRMFGCVISPGRVLKSDTKAFHLTEDVEHNSDFGAVRNGSWLDASNPETPLPLHEDSVSLPDYGKVLTILTFDQRA